VNDYRSHVFDMDGVLLASNGIKSEAFRKAAQRYGDEAAEAMVALHQSAGSISRRERVERFFAEVLDASLTADEVEQFMAAVSDALRDGYREAEPVPGAADYVASVSGRAVVVTGAEQPEARAILGARGLMPSEHVYGGPPAKTDRLAELIADGTIEMPAVYYGDTLDDYEAARANDMDFVLVTGDAEWDWERWSHRRHKGLVSIVEDFRLLLPEEPQRPTKVRIGRDGYAEVDGERRYFGRSLAGAEVTA
jgi:phosphoglycolate phosphatase-like HAD superfamily hydrolase